MKFSTKNSKGFTLPEMLIAATIGVTAVALASSFFIETLRTSLGIENNLEINSDVRKLANEMANIARTSNGFIIYDSFFKDDTDNMQGDFRNPANDQSPNSYRIRANNSGNFCVFYFIGIDETPADANPAPYERLVGYYYSGENELRKFDITINRSNQFDRIEDLIPPERNNNFHKVLFEEVETLQYEKLFYNLNNVSVIVNAKINHGTPSQKTKSIVNFTISPRG